MIIKKMKLQNFRQYIDDEIKFAVDGDCLLYTSDAADE